MANELQYYANPDTDTGQSITAKVYSDAGSQVGSDVACSEVGSLAIYQGDMPTASAGVYTVRFFESSSFVAQGTIEWDGAAEITGVSLNTAIANNSTTTLDEADIHAALASYTGKNEYKADISNLESRAEADAHYQALNIEHTETQSAIANLNDFDPASENVTLSSTTQAAIATAVEQAILDENDGSQILNAIVGAIGNSNVDEIALVAAIRSDLERQAGTLDRIDNASIDLTPVQDAIAALNDFDPANDTVARVTANTDSDEIKTEIVNLSLLSERITDILEADETYDKASGKARKLLRGTSVVLLEKTVQGSSVIESVSIAE